LIRSGAIPSIRVAAAGSRKGRILIRRQALEAYVARLESTAPPPRPKVDVDDLLRKVRRT